MHRSLLYRIIEENFITTRIHPLVCSPAGTEKRLVSRHRAGAGICAFRMVDPASAQGSSNRETRHQLLRIDNTGANL